MCSVRCRRRLLSRRRQQAQPTRKPQAPRTTEQEPRAQWVIPAPDALARPGAQWAAIAVPHLGALPQRRRTQRLALLRLPQALRREPHQTPRPIKHRRPLMPRAARTRAQSLPTKKDRSHLRYRPPLLHYRLPGAWHQAKPQQQAAPKRARRAGRARHTLPHVSGVWLELSLEHARLTRARARPLSPARQPVHDCGVKHTPLVDARKHPTPLRLTKRRQSQWPVAASTTNGRCRLFASACSRELSVRHQRRQGTLE